MLDTKRVVKGVLGKKQDIRNLVKDSDRDGVSNVLDCKPFNPRQQGLVHKAGAAIARELGARRMAGRIEKREVAVEAAKEEAREERAKQLKETAIFREQQRGERQRAFIKGGGVFGVAKRAFAPVARPRPVRRLSARVARRKLPKVTKRKVSRKAVGRVVRRPVPAPKKEKDRLSSMLGV